MVPGHVSEKALSGNLRYHYGDRNENVRKISKHAAPFLQNSLPSMHNYDVKLPSFTCYRERKQTTKNLNISLKKSTLGEFANIWESEHVETIALKFQKTQSDFLSDVFNAVAVVWYC